MRTNDVAIGIAVARARYYGEDIACCGNEHDRYNDLLVWSQDNGAWDVITVDRGPPFDPETLGPGSWIRVPTSGYGMYAFADALLRATEARAQSIREAGARARRRA